MASPSAPTFEALHQRFSKRAGPPASFVAFDLLDIDGQDLRPEPLRVRRAALEVAVAPNPHLMVTAQTEDREVALAWIKGPDVPGLEGVVAKRADESYRPGRKSWIKVKH